MRLFMKKTCSRCDVEKDISLFQIRKASKDGYTAACKACLSSYDKARANNASRVKAREEYAKSDRGIAAGVAARQRYIDRNPVKRKAHIIVGNAIRDGKLHKQPCEECGNSKVHAHHDDYAKPLNVRWLCPAHHSQWHEVNGDAANAS